MSVMFLPRKIEDVRRVNRVEEVPSVFVPGARVLWANYELLIQDFPFLKTAEKERVDSWLVDSFSYISEAQFELAGLRSTEIPRGQELRTAYRQPTQGRGDLFPVHDFDGKEVGLLDRKGVGVSQEKLQENLEFHGKATAGEISLPEFERSNNKNGLFGLNNAVIETIVAESLSWLFDIESAKVDDELPASVIGHYFILQLPFEILNGELETVTPVIMSRQAHIGRVWIGTNPYRKTMSNIKQTDFFGSYTDTDTTRIRHHEFFPEFITGERGSVHGMSMGKLVEAEGKSVTEFIDKTIAPLRVGIAKKKKRQPKCETLLEAVRIPIAWILHEPIKYHRYAEGLAQLQRFTPEILQDPSVAEDLQAVILRLLEFSWEELEGFETNGALEDREPPRFNGLLLFASLDRAQQESFLKTCDDRDLYEIAKTLPLIEESVGDRVLEKIERLPAAQKAFEMALEELTGRSSDFYRDRLNHYRLRHEPVHSG